MGVSATGFEMATKIRRLADGMPKAAATGIVKAAAVMEASVAAASGRYAGRPIVRTRSEITVLPEPVAVVRMTSRKAHLLDHDTKAHPIGPRRAQVLLIGGHPISGDVKHPGTKGKFMWETALVAARPRIAAVMDSQIAGHMISVFGI